MTHRPLSSRLTGPTGEGVLPLVTEPADMGSGGDRELVGSRNPVFEGIAAPRRREILGVLLDSDRPVTEQELATHLATSSRRPSRTDLSPTEVQAIRSDVGGLHLPKLEEAGLVDWNRDEATVETSTHPALDDPRLELLLDAEGDGLDEVLSRLANERQRILLTVLRGERGPMSEEELGLELVRRERGATDPDSRAVDVATASLSYAHLPKLADVDLVDYDPEAGRVTYRAHPTLEEVFTVIYEPETCLVDTYDGFLSGLEAAYRRLGRTANEEAEWPHFWRDPHHG